MQSNAPPFNLSTLGYALLWLASPLTGFLTALLTHFFTRPKQSAEIHKTNAETGKTEAETRAIDSAILHKAYERLDDLEDVAHKQGLEVTRLNQRVMTLEFEGRAKDGRNSGLEEELKILNLQLQRAKAKGFLVEDRAPHSPNPAAGLEKRKNES